MSGTGKVVCVTGATGYIASWLVKFLLLRGYKVHATVRDPNDASKVKHLTELEGAKERLHLFKANLLEEGSFDAAVSGCHGVFHTASPLLKKTNYPQADLLDPAIKGTLNVLNSCKKVPSITRIVLTSSFSAMFFTGKPLTADVVVDETWFSDAELCRKTKMWYFLSKTSAEEAAWKFVKENGMDMVCLNPTMAIGPMLQPTLNESIYLIYNLVNGTKTYPNATYPWVDVRDVATAHILAFEVPSAQGRYCITESVAHYSEIVRNLRGQFPTVTLPDKCADDLPSFPNFQVSAKKSQSDLGLNYIPLTVSLKETVEDFVRKGFVAF